MVFALLLWSLLSFIVISGDMRKLRFPMKLSAGAQRLPIVCASSHVDIRHAFINKSLAAFDRNNHTFSFLSTRQVALAKVRFGASFSKYRLKISRKTRAKRVYTLVSHLFYLEDRLDEMVQHILISSEVQLPGNSSKMFIPCLITTFVLLVSLNSIRLRRVCLRRYGYTRSVSVTITTSHFVNYRPPILNSRACHGVKGAKRVGANKTSPQPYNHPVCTSDLLQASQSHPRNSK